MTIYNIFNSLVYEKARIVYLKGALGSGKSSIAKVVSNYMQERGLVNNVHYLNMSKINSMHVFMAKIPGYTNSAFNQIESTLKSSNLYGGENDTLMILDNMD